MQKVQDLHRKLTLHKETDLVDIHDDIDELIRIAQDAASEVDDLEDEISEKESKILDLMDDADAADEEPISSNAVRNYGLIGEQVVDAFQAILNHQNTNQSRFLELLDLYKFTGYKG